METKLKKLLKKRKISQKRLYDKIAKRYETPVGQYALSEIVNGKKINYHLITLVKICNVLSVKPHSIVESEILETQLLKHTDLPTPPVFEKY
jgi:DNA-binding Xre family transcriptional regulator